MRTTARDEIIIGGEDETSADAEERDRQIPAKVERLLQSLQALLPQARLEIDTAWAGFFSQTDDGLPLIGPVPNYPRCYAAFGYGGNGITFSALAASMIRAIIETGRHPLQELVAIDRDA
jgi:glycine/D-amino acid oxidase-like deaminating enzyme